MKTYGEGEWMKSYVNGIFCLLDFYLTAKQQLYKQLLCVVACSTRRETQLIFSPNEAVSV